MVQLNCDISGQSDATETVNIEFMWVPTHARLCLPFLFFFNSVYLPTKPTVYFWCLYVVIHVISCCIKSITVFKQTLGQTHGGYPRVRYAWVFFPTLICNFSNGS